MTKADRQSTTVPWIIRQTTNQDRSRVAGLLSRAKYRHLHLDWYTAYELLDESPSFIALDGDIAVGILACPQDPAGVSWIRYFAVRDGERPEDLWGGLWERCIAIAPDTGIRTIAALVTQDWFIPILKSTGVEQTTEVIFLEWKGDEIQVELPLHASLRRMTEYDLDAVASVDKIAFQPIWQHSKRALEAAFHLTAFATVMEVDGRVVAYQMSTASALGAHLARLAVEPEMQAQGLAKALVKHAIKHFQQRGIDRMSVNTQADNQRSQYLYEKLGFTLTGQRFPVFVYDLR